MDESSQALELIAEAERADPTNPGKRAEYVLDRLILRKSGVPFVAAASMALDKLQPILTELFAENDQLRNRIKQQSALLDGKFEEWSKLRIKSMGPAADGTFEINTQAEIIPMLAELLASDFERAGGENYIAFGISHTRLGPLTLTLQRELGETPAAQAGRWKEEAEKYRVALQVIRDHCDSGYLTDVVTQDRYFERIDEILGAMGLPAAPLKPREERRATPSELLSEEIKKLKAERDDADRRAGAVARTTAKRIAQLEDGQRRREEWLNDRKREVWNAGLGYPHHISFDVVWADAFAALKEKRSAEKGSKA